MVPFVRMKLVMRILLGSDIFPSFSANTFFQSPVSFLLTTVFLNMGGELEK